MAVEVGYSSAHNGKIVHSLVCSCCGKYLGNQEIDNGKEYDDIEEWEFYPYCGHSLYEGKQKKEVFD